MHVTEGKAVFRLVLSAKLDELSGFDRTVWTLIT
jgi:hypothetical protein